VVALDRRDCVNGGRGCVRERRGCVREGRVCVREGRVCVRVNPPLSARTPATHTQSGNLFRECACVRVYVPRVHPRA